MANGTLPSKKDEEVGKSKITLAISIVFAATVIRNRPVGVEGANSRIGLWHYKIGLLMAIRYYPYCSARLPFLSIFKR